MKIKTTRRAIVNSSPRIVSAGYCDLSYLLRPVEPFAYTCGVYGWNFDAYKVDGLTICMGYRNMPGRTANGIREYEERARAIWHDPRKYDEYGYDERLADARDLLSEFVAQA